jgi:peptide/nickel transport system substrate-binding protein
MITAQEDGVGNEYTRNPDYWKPGLPYLDKIRTPYFADAQAAYAAFVAGQVDIDTLPGTEVKGYVSKQGKDYTPDWYNDDSSLPGVPNTKKKPFDDRRVTRALRLLVDHPEWLTTWTDVWFGGGQHASIFTTALQETWDFPQDKYVTMLEWKPQKDEAVREALSLLSAAGFTRDNQLKFELSGTSGGFNEAAVQLLQAQWRRLGQGVVETNLKIYDTTNYIKVRNERGFDYMVMGNSGSVVDPDSWFAELYQTGGSKNFLGLADAKADAMIERQRVQFDIQQRKVTVKEIIQYMIDEGLTTMNAVRKFLNGVNPRVRGYAPEFYFVGRQYERMWLAG